MQTQKFTLSLQMKGLKQTTIDHYIQYLRMFYEYTGISDVGLGDRDTIESAYSRLWDKDITNATRKKYLVVLRIYSDYLVRRGIIAENTARMLDVPRCQTRLATVCATTEIHTILDSVDTIWDTTYTKNKVKPEWNIAHRNKMIVLFILYTGVRRSEVSSILCSDCTKDSVRVRDGKGGKDRMIYIPAWLGTIIQEYIQISHVHSVYLFSGLQRDSISPHGISCMFGRIKKHTGLDIHPHKLRHTYATESIRAGINIHTIQRQMGHSNIKTTSLYLSIRDDDRRDEVQKVKNGYARYF